MSDESGTSRSGTRRLLWWSSVMGVTGSAAVMFMTSARPGALVFRSLLERSNRANLSSAARSIPGVRSVTDVHYEPSDPDARFDVYFPASVATDDRLPAVVWVHGGAWISSTKDVAAPYFALLARSGVVVIAVEYSRAPDAKYPTPLVQINDAIAYVQRHAAQFHVDEARIILAGDSAGAQMASQIATLVTNPAYSLEVGILPSLRPDQLRAAILFCGVFNAAGVARHPRLVPNAALTSVHPERVVGLYRYSRA